MDALALLRRAREAGLRVEPAGDKLIVRGPKSAEPVVKLLAERKADVLAALANTAPEAETGLSMPCTSRRGHVAELPSGLISHFCTECGAWGAFGYGVNLRAGRKGQWYCVAHRPQGAAP